MKSINSTSSYVKSLTMEAKQADVKLIKLSLKLTKARITLMRIEKDYVDFSNDVEKLYDRLYNAKTALVDRTNEFEEDYDNSKSKTRKSKASKSKASKSKDRKSKDRKSRVCDVD